ncbi:hypothetical protein TUM20983_39200 [Mycobacterium antarcticum]|nr:hypothetical protein TUM20983_39200 [Mycolicibacterium sp. TUM20983]
MDSGGGAAADPEAEVVPAPPVVGVAGGSEVEDDGDCDGEDESSAGVGAEVESDGTAWAIPSVVASANPNVRATASAPARPICAT